MSASLHSINGVIAYVNQPTFGTAVTPTTAVGCAEFNVTDDGDFRQVFTVGKANLHKNKPGIAKTPFSISLPSVQTKTFIMRAARSSGVVPYTTFGFGVNDGTTIEQWQVQDAFIDTLEMSLDGGSFLSASVTGTGRVISTISSLSALHLTEQPFMSYEGVLTYGGAAFEVKTFRMSVNHNHTLESVVTGAARTSGRKRYWDYNPIGHEVITGSVSLTQKITVGATSFGADCPTSGSNAVLTLTEICSGSNTLTLTLTTPEFSSQTRNVPLDGLIGYELPFNAYGFTIA